MTNVYVRLSELPGKLAVATDTLTRLWRTDRAYADAIADFEAVCLKVATTHLYIRSEPLMIHFHAQAEEMMQVAYTALAKALVSLPEEKLPVGSFRDNSAWDLLEIYKLHRSVYSDTVQVKRIGQYLENLAKLNLLRKWQGFALFLLVCPVEIRARLLDDSSTVLGMSYETREAWMRYALVDDTLWPTVFAKPWTRANQRKSWAHSLRIWDFSATSPTMLVNTNDEIRGVTMGRPEEGVVAEQLPQERPMARTLDLLSQCLVGREWYQSRGVQDLDALITLVSQKRHWDATHETLYVTSQTSFRFFNGFINMAPASHEEHHPPQQPGLGTLMSFFTADSVDSDEGWDRTLLIMPIHAPGHFTLAAFWWINSNEGTREMGCAYFDSIASNDVDTEFTTPLLEPLKQLYNFNVAAGHPLHYKQFDGVELHQRLSSATYDTGGGQCPAIVLYEMDFLCTHTVKNITPQARVQQLFDSVKQAHTRATRPEEKYSVLSDAAERWTRRSILPDPKSGRLGWEPQVQMLQSLHTITRVMAERDENFPLLTDWTAGLRTVVTLALREERSGNVDNRFMYAAMMDALSLNRVLQHWRHHIVHAYMQADKDHRLAALHTFRLGLQDDPVVHDHMFSGVWTPTPEVGAALTTLFALVPSRMDQQLQMYLEVWYLHVLFFPVRPRGAAALRFARAYWAEMSLNTDMLEAVLWRRDSVGGEKRARFAFLLKAIRDKGTHRHRALAVLRSAYTAFLEDGRELNNITRRSVRFASENVLGTLWPNYMVLVMPNDAGKVRDTRENAAFHWNPRDWLLELTEFEQLPFRPLAAGILRGMVACWHITRPRDTTDNITRQQWTENVKEVDTLFPSTSWERAGVILLTDPNTEDAATQYHLRVALARVMLNASETKNMQEALGDWKAFIRAWVDLETNSRAAAEAYIYDPRIRQLLLEDEGRRLFPVGGIKEHYLIKWADRASAFLTNPPVDKCIDLTQQWGVLVTRIEEERRFLTDHGALDRLNGRPDEYDAKLKVYLSMRKSLLELDRASREEYQRVEALAISVIPGKIWDTVPEIAAFRTAFTTFRRALDQHDDLEQELEQLSEDLPELIMNAGGLPSVPAPLQPLFTTYKDTDAELNSLATLDVFFDSVTWQQYASSPIGPTNREHLSPATQVQYAKALALLTRADAVHGAMKAKVEARLISSRKDANAAADDERSRQSRVINDDALLTQAQLAASLSPYKLWLQDETASAQLLVPFSIYTDQPYNGEFTNPDALGLWVDELRDKADFVKIAFTEEVIAGDAELDGSHPFTWFDNEIQEILDDVLNGVDTIENRYKGLANDVHSAFMYLYGGRAALSRVGDIIETFLPRDSPSKRSLLAAADVPFPRDFVTFTTPEALTRIETSLEQRFTEIAEAAHFYYNTFNHPGYALELEDDDVPPDRRKYCGWQKFYITRDARGVADEIRRMVAAGDSFYPLLFNEAVLAQVYVVHVDQWVQLRRREAEPTPRVTEIERAAVFDQMRRLLGYALRHSPTFQKRMSDAANDARTTFADMIELPKWAAYEALVNATMNTLQDDAVFPTGTISGNVKYHSLGMPGAVGTFKASITRVNAGTLEWRARFTQWRSAVSFFYWWERVFSPGIQELALPVVDRLRVAYLTHSRDRQDVEFNVEYTLKPLISRLFPMGADAELPVSVVELADSPIASLEREKGDALDYPAVALLSQPNLTELTDAEADLTQRIYNVLNAALHDANVNIPTNVRNQWMGDLGLRDLDLIGKQQDIQRLIQYVPYLIPAPVSDAQLNTLFTRLTDLVDQENLTRALLALDLLRVKTTPIPPASLKTKAIRALYESDSADYNLSYLPPAEEAAARVIPRDALVEMEGALQQYAEIQRIAMEYVARARDHWYERVASARLTLVPAFEVILLDANQTVAGLDVALPPMPTFDDYYRLSSVNGTTLQESDSMISVIPLFAAALPDRLDFQDWNRRFTLVVTARTRVRQTRLDYTTGVDTLRTEVQRLTQPGVRLVVGAGLQGVVDGAQRFRDEIRQSQREVERTLRMPPTLATLKEYEARLAPLLTRVTTAEELYMNGLKDTTIRYNDPVERDRYRAALQQLGAYLVEAETSVLRLRDAVAAVRASGTAADVELARVLASPKIKNVNWIARYMDEGVPGVRPAWIDSDNDAEVGVSITRAMFAVEVKDSKTGEKEMVPRYPTDKDRWRWAGQCSPQQVAEIDAAADARAMSFAERRRQAEEALHARDQVRNIPASKERVAAAGYVIV